MFIYFDMYTLQVLLTLRYYATGTFQSVMADMIGISQSTASRAITRGISQYDICTTVSKLLVNVID